MTIKCREIGLVFREENFPGRRVVGSASDKKKKKKVGKSTFRKSPEVR